MPIIRFALESEAVTERLERYKKKNELFAVWLSGDLYEWFTDYLKRKSHGSGLPDLFRNYIEKLKIREETGVTSASKELRESHKPTSTEGIRKEWVCLRDLPKHPSPSQQRIRCQICKTKNFKVWKACQETKEEHQQAL